MRYRSLDVLRGFALVNMIIYHGLWDMVNIWNVKIPWFYSDVAHLWQQCICSMFILLSGFCFNFGRRKLKRGLLILACSALITLITVVFMSENLILFGILSFFGSAMLIMLPFDRVLKNSNPYICLIISLSLFILTKNIAFGGLPNSWYANLFTAYLGLPPRGFVSQDYFPIIPWLFLYIAGYFLFMVFKKHNLLDYLNVLKCKPLEWIGKRSLVIYMLHQPILYIVLYFICLI